MQFTDMVLSTKDHIDDEDVLDMYDEASGLPMGGASAAARPPASRRRTAWSPAPDMQRIFNDLSASPNAHLWAHPV